MSRFLSQNVSGRTSASVPPSTKSTLPTMNDECSLNIQCGGGGDLVGFGPTPDRHRDRPHQRADLGIGEGRLRSAACSVLPGANALRRIPSAAHAGACRRTQRANASLTLAYATPPAPTCAAARASSPSRHAATSASSTGATVAAARRHRDRGGATAPDERAAQALEHRDAAEVADVDELRGRLDGRRAPRRTRRSRRATPSHRSSIPATAASRPAGGAEVGDHLGVAQVDADDACPSASSRRRVAAPMPDADPVNAIPAIVPPRGGRVGGRPSAGMLTGRRDRSGLSIYLSKP